MQPTSPDPQFDFMLKNNQPAKKGLGLPRMSKPVKIILGLIAAVFLLIVISSVLSDRQSGATQPVINSMARGQETLRITQLAQQQLRLKDPTTQALAATVLATLTSDQQQLKTYLAANKTKLSAAILAAKTDKTTDAQLQSASQNNNLDSAYMAYLRDSLAKYRADLQTAYSSAGPKGKLLLNEAFASSTTLLSSPPLK